MDKPNKTQFTFVETKKNRGLVDKIDAIAEQEQRNRNDYLNILLSKHVQDYHEIEENLEE